jgi:hypothetical protein
MMTFLLFVTVCLVFRFLTTNNLKIDNHTKLPVWEPPEYVYKEQENNWRDAPK